MAPSFEIGNPQRSLVRIPGSGQDKSLKPICLDVAQISACARTLGTIVNFNFESPPDQAVSGTLSISPVIPPFATSSSGSSNGNSNQNSNYRNKRSAEDEGPSAKRSHTVVQPRVKYLMRNIRLSPKDRREKMEKLKKSKQALKEENEILEKKVAKFKEIILSKSKLNMFLKTLKEMEVN
ncbi:UNVERIFIED_CONTAM: hypothetical protein RMT77_002778 [Armadillidium vulgare]